MQLSSIVKLARQFMLNMKACRPLPKIPTQVKVAESLYMSYATAKEVREMYKEHGKSIPWYIITLAFRKKICFVLRNDENEFLAGCAFYYNLNEYKLNIIHLSYHFVMENKRGQGYGKLISIASETYVMNHYPVKAIRIRVLKSNTPSLKCRIASGYKLIEQIEMPGGDTQYYLELPNTKRNE